MSVENVDSACSFDSLGEEKKEGEGNWQRKKSRAKYSLAVLNSA